MATSPLIISPAPFLDTDIIAHILFFCPMSTLSRAARVSHDLNDLAIPLLYRHLSLDITRPNPLFPPESYISADLPGTASPHAQASLLRHLRYTRTLHIVSHDRSQCCRAHASISTPAARLPNLRSLHFEIGIHTYHWPHGCPLLHSLSLTPPEIVLSGAPGCDVLFWTFGTRYHEVLPDSVQRLVFNIKCPPGVALRAMSDGWDKVTSSLDSVFNDDHSKLSAKEIVLVYDDSWGKMGDVWGYNMEPELGNIEQLLRW